MLFSRLPMRAHLLFIFAVASVVLFGGSSSAHDADIVFAKIDRAAHEGSVEEKVTMTAGTLAQLATLDVSRGLIEAELQRAPAAIDSGVWAQMPLTSSGTPCSRAATRASLREGYIELGATFQCAPGTLQQTFKFLPLLPPGYRVIVSAQLSSGPVQRFAEGENQTVSLSASASGEAGHAPIQGLRGWFELGVVHIFGGIDHLAFLIALLIVGGNWRRILLMVTAFTLAHSMTLGATALNLIVLDATRQRWAEAAIAISIVYVALENLVFKEHKHRALITFAFGLVHGFGFASVLTSYGLGNSKLVGLLGFNLGVEAGQACIVGCLYPLVAILRRRPLARLWVVRLASLSILSAGSYWLVERVTG